MNCLLKPLTGFYFYFIISFSIQKFSTGLKVYKTLLYKSTITFLMQRMWKKLGFHANFLKLVLHEGGIWLISGFWKWPRAVKVLFSWWRKRIAHFLISSSWEVAEFIYPGLRRIVVEEIQRVCVGISEVNWK